MPEFTWVDYAMALLKGAGVTLQMSWLALVVAAVIGTLLAALRMIRFLPTQILATALIEVLRSTPVILLLFFAYYGVPAFLRLNVPGYVAATAALGLHSSAAMSVIVMAGVQSVSKGQWEAAAATGLSRGQAIWHIIAPQAIRLILPPGVSVFTSTVKASALTIVIGSTEIMHTALQIRDLTGAGLQIIVVAGLMYFTINFAVSQFGQWLERRFNRHVRGTPIKDVDSLQVAVT